MLPIFNFPELVRSAHRLIEANEGGNRISRTALSERIGVSARTLTEYERGTNQPKATHALLLLLAQLPDEQIVWLVRQFEKDVNRDKDI
jgi:putative transcriptional regulator